MPDIELDSIQRTTVPAEPTRRTLVQGGLGTILFEPAKLQKPVLAVSRLEDGTVNATVVIAKGPFGTTDAVIPQ